MRWNVGEGDDLTEIDVEWCLLVGIEMGALEADLTRLRVTVNQSTCLLLTPEQLRVDRRLDHTPWPAMHRRSVGDLLVSFRQANPCQMLLRVGCIVLFVHEVKLT